MAIGLALGAVGLATSVIGGLQSASAQRKATREKYKAALEQATEVVERNEIKSSLMRKAADRFIGQQQVQIAASGRAADVTTSGMLEQTFRSAEEQIDRNNRVTDWQRNVIVANAQSSYEAGMNMAEATAISTIGGGLMSAGKMYDAAPSMKRLGFSPNMGKDMKAGLNEFLDAINPYNYDGDWSTFQ